MSLFSLLSRCYREKATKAFQITQVFHSGKYERAGVLYIQNGQPKSCVFNELEGEESLFALYKNERNGGCLLYKELDCLDIYAENVVSDKFEDVMLNLLEKFRLSKITSWKFNKMSIQDESDSVHFLQ